MARFVLWPGRIQKIYNTPNVYYDVAHNQASFESLCSYVNTLKGQKILVLALQKNKNLNKVLNTIESSFDKIIITQTNVRNFMPAQELSCLFNINSKKLTNMGTVMKRYNFISKLWISQHTINNNLGTT